MSDKVVINRLSTGVPGLDALLAGGIPEFSFNVIAGHPGSGKTTLAHQIMFGCANAGMRSLYFTVLGEPPLKMLRYQQQYDFFDVTKVGESIRFVNLAEETASGQFDAVLARIADEMKRIEPQIVIVDSFRSIVQAAADGSNGHRVPLQQFVLQLGMHLASWQVTSFLVGEYMSIEHDAHPVFTVADGILWMSQSTYRNSMVRKIQVTKMRGTALIPGLHTFRIDRGGIRVFPRTLLTDSVMAGDMAGGDRVAQRFASMGIPALDQMMGGGLPTGYSLLVAGPTGSGKTLLSTSFLGEGARIGEKSVVAAFEKSPGRSRNPRLDQLVSDGLVEVIDTRALDLSTDETLYALVSTVRRTGATRVVIDSLSGFELSLAPAFREEFRESLHRMVAVLTSMGVTIVMTCELEDRYSDLRFSPYGAAFLTDAIIVQRYVELSGELKRVMGVVKVRNTAHSHALRLYDITDAGFVVHESRAEMEGLLTGHPRIASGAARAKGRP